MAAGKVTVTRGELSQVRALLEQAVAELDELINRKETQPVEHDSKGWPLLGGDES
jgi:hypothetical protein